MNERTEAMAISTPRPLVSGLKIMTRMFWKEARQLWPILTIFTIIAVVLHWFIAMRGDVAAFQEIRSLPHLLLPFLFAIAAGSVLVSLERDQRTLDWYDSLPMSRSKVFATKFVVGILGLFLFWTISFGIQQAASRSTPMVLSSEAMTSSRHFNALSAAFLFGLSFSTAWIFRKTLIALMMLVPINWGIIQVTQMLHPSESRFMSERFLSTSINGYWVVTLTLLIVAWMKARNVWSSSLSPWLSWSNLRGTWLPNKLRTSLTRRTIPFAALIWQFGRQNGIPFLCFATAFTGLVFVDHLQATPGWSSSNGKETLQALSAALFLLSILGVLWIGTLVFVSDTSKSRSRFLAEHGVSAGMVWLTRLTLPLLVVSLSLAICWALGRNRETVPQGVSYLLSENTTHFNSIALIFLCFAFSMWWGQVCRSPIIAICLSPAIGFLVAICFGRSPAQLMMMPWWCLLFVSLTPFIATAVMTRPWMEGNANYRHYLFQLGMLAAAVLVPFLPLFYDLWSLPAMPIKELEKHLRARNALGEPLPSWQFTFSKKPFQVSELYQSGSLSDKYADVPPIGQIMEQFVQQLDRSFDEHIGPLDSEQAMTVVLQEALLTSMRLQVHPTDEDARRRYRQAMQLLLKVIRRSRSDGSLRMQAFMDQIESLLVDQACRPGTDSHLGEALYRELVTQLADANARTEARRRAVLRAWRPRGAASSSSNSAGPPDMNAFGGFVVFQQELPYPVYEFLLRRYRDVLAIRLLRLAECRTPNEADTAFQDVADLFQLNKDDLVDRRALEEIPGSKWHTGWEQRAVELGKKLEESWR